MLSQYFSFQKMSQFQYCLSIDPDHDKGESNLRWIVMQQMYKLKTDVQNNHGIGLVGIMQVGGGQKKADWQSVWFCQKWNRLGTKGDEDIQAKGSK